MSEEYDLSADLAIDFYNLHKNCAEQPLLYKKWADLWADATSKRDRLKEKLEYKKAVLNQEIRSELIDTGIKYTEAMVSAQVEIHDEIRGLKRKLNDANTEVNKLSCAKSAFEQRKSMLQLTCELWVKEYWSDPKVSYQTETVATKKMTELRSQEQKDKLNKLMQRKRTSKQ